MPAPRPKLINPKVSHVIPELQVISPDQGGSPCVVVGTCRWGAVTLCLDEVGIRPDGEVGGGLHVWQISAKAEWLHLGNYKAWSVIPTTPCSPLQSRRWFPSAVRPGIFLAQTAAPIPLLKYAFGQSVSSLSFTDLKDLADIVGVDTKGCRSSKAEVLQCIAMHIAAGDGLDAAQAFASKAVELAEMPAPSCFIDPLTEAAFNELDQNEQKEFGDVKDKIAVARKTGRIIQARKRAAAEMQGESDVGGRGRGAGRGRGRRPRGLLGLRGRGRRSDSAVAAAEPEPLAPPPPPPPAREPLVQPPALQVRPTSFRLLKLGAHNVRAGTIAFVCNRPSFQNLSVLQTKLVGLIRSIAGLAIR